MIRYVISRFGNWLTENVTGRPVLVSDNAGYDWQFVNWYFHYFLGRNPFGHSAIDLISEDGERTFYAELSDTYEPDDCSYFAQEAVLPLLEGGDLNASSCFGCI